MNRQGSEKEEQETTLVLAPIGLFPPFTITEEATASEIRRQGHPNRGGQKAKSLAWNAQGFLHDEELDNERKIGMSLPSAKQRRVRAEKYTFCRRKVARRREATPDEKRLSRSRLPGPPA
jgi:hypothetical protein